MAKAEMYVVALQLPERVASGHKRPVYVGNDMCGQAFAKTRATRFTKEAAEAEAAKRTGRICGADYKAWTVPA